MLSREGRLAHTPPPPRACGGRGRGGAVNIKVYLTIGLVGCDREEVIEIDDEELEGLDEETRRKVFEEYLKDWAYNYIEYGYEEVG